MKIISEISKEAKEGVADKFVQQEPQLVNVPGEFDDFEKRFREETQDEENGEVIYHSTDMKILKNPKTLKNIGSNVRGVITTNGDLYIEQESVGIHNDILNILKGKGIVPDETKKLWGGRLPQQSGFLTVQRYKDTNTIAIGESNRLIYTKEAWKNYIKYYDIFLNKAQSKSSGINYTNKLIGLKTGSSDNENVINKTYQAST